MKIFVAKKWNMVIVMDRDRNRFAALLWQRHVFMAKTSTLYKIFVSDNIGNTKIALDIPPL